MVAHSFSIRSSSWRQSGSPTPSPSIQFSRAITAYLMRNLSPDSIALSTASSLACMSSSACASALKAGAINTLLLKHIFLRIIMMLRFIYVYSLISNVYSVASLLRSTLNIIFYVFTVFALLSLATIGWKLTLDNQLTMVVDALWPVETVIWSGLLILMSVKTVGEAIQLRKMIKQ